MSLPILGLHHVTSKSSDPRATDRFWRNVMGLRRVKQTVNFDNPKVYHLYFGNEAGDAGTVMTYFPFPGLAAGERGTGEVSEVSYSVPRGSLDLWEAHLERAGAGGLLRDSVFGDSVLEFEAPDGDRFRLVERAVDKRRPWPGSAMGRNAIHGFDGVALCLAETDSTAAILAAFGYREVGCEGATTRWELPGGPGANIVDLVLTPDMPKAKEGAGSVHHVAFAVRDRASQAIVADAMRAEGHRVTHVYDRNYFYAVYFRTPGGVLFEVATCEPGFDADEDISTLGERLKLPEQHEHLRPDLEQSLIPLD